jgi:hypothetical protein
MWDLWWTKRKWDRFLLEYFGFSLSISLHRCSITRKTEKNNHHHKLHNKPQGFDASVTSAAPSLFPVTGVILKDQITSEWQLLPFKVKDWGLLSIYQVCTFLLKDEFGLLYRNVTRRAVWNSVITEDRKESDLQAAMRGPCPSNVTMCYFVIFSPRHLCWFTISCALGVRPAECGKYRNTLSQKMTCPGITYLCSSTSWHFP